MKKVMMVVMTMLGFTAVNAQSPVAKEVAEAKPIVKANSNADTDAAPCDDAPLDVVKGAPDYSANYVGTNDLNLNILREGIKRA